jgi:1-acyl-sn-glycerol-3-phosphate acyltransferase
MHFMGKAELLKVPLFRQLFKKMNIPVDRKNKIAAAKSLAKATKDLQRGISIGVFPEGTISKQAPKMSSFKAGAFKMAIDNQVRILPVTFVNNYHLFPEKIKNGWAGRPGIAKIVVHEPISTVGMNSDTDVKALSKQTFDVIEGTLKERIKDYELL